LARSLERLGLGYVDLYLVHWPVPLRSGPGWAELVRLREQGLARAIGVSNYGGDRLAGMLGRTTPRPAVNQVLFSPLHFRRRLLEFCQQHEIVLEAYSPLERGRALQHPVIVETARRLERTPAQVLLRWALQHGAVVIPKSSRRERIQSNARLFDFELDANDMRTLDALDTTGGTGKGH
jgi:diketogulonate reductase-like aldo/keto reductase